MKKIFLCLAAALLTAHVTKAQAPTIAPGQGFVNGLGIGVPVGPNYSDASLHIKATPNSYYNSGNGQSLIYCETDNAFGDYMRLSNSKGGVGGTFAPFLFGTVITDPAVSAFQLGGNINSAADVLNTSPALLFRVMKDFVPQTSQTYPGSAALPIANRPLFQWLNASNPLMTMFPTSLTNGESRLALGMGTTVPAFKFDVATPGTNDGIRITNTGTTSASLRMRGSAAPTFLGTHDWALQSSGTASGAGPGNLFFYDYTPTVDLYRFFIKGTSGNIGIGNTNSLTINPQLRLDINTPNQNDGIRVTQTGNTAATLSLVGGSPANVGTAPGQSRRWALFSTGSANTNVGAGHLLFWDWTTNVERMRIHQNGNVGINTTGLPGPSHILHVKSRTVSGANQDPVRIETLNAATDNNLVTVDATGVLHTRSISSLPSAGITSSCATVNQVPKMDATGNLTCSSIYDNGNVGIGTSSPLHKMHIDNGALMLSGAVPGFGGPQLLFSDNLTTHPNGRWAIEYMTATATRPSMGGLNFWTPSPGGSAGNYSLFLKDDGKIGMGVTDDNTHPNYSATAFNGNYRLYVKGGILTDKVKVAVYNSGNWADYVFAPDYKLKSLEEVEAFTKANKHLPGVKSAEELTKDGGIDVSEMLTKQMEKIEELTLYMIEMKKEINTLKNENAGLKTNLSTSKN